MVTHPIIGEGWDIRVMWFLHAKGIRSDGIKLFIIV